MFASFTHESLFGSTVLRFDSLESTNGFLSGHPELDLLKEGTAVIAEKQTNGRGQMGSVWESEENKNLTVSYLIRPHFLAVQEQFLLAKMVALAVYQSLSDMDEQKDGWQIKWPNDIYVNHQKIAGILIENTIQGDKITHSVIGIGINVNQEFFPAAFNAVSLKQRISKKTEPEIIFNSLNNALNQVYFLLKSGNRRLIDERYLKKLYQLEVYARFSMKDEIFKAKITGVDKSGKLQLEKENGEKISAGLKEINFLREP